MTVSHTCWYFWGSQTLFDYDVHRLNSNTEWALVRTAVTRWVLWLGLALWPGSGRGRPRPPAKAFIAESRCFTHDSALLILCIFALCLAFLFHWFIVGPNTHPTGAISFPRSPQYYRGVMELPKVIWWLRCLFRLNCIRSRSQPTLQTSQWRHPRVRAKPAVHVGLTTTPAKWVAQLPAESESVYFPDPVLRSCLARSPFVHLEGCVR